MVSAVVLLSMQRDRINEVAQELVALDGVTEVYSVAGQWDLVAVVRVKDNDALAELVTGAILEGPWHPALRDAHRLPRPFALRPRAHVFGRRRVAPLIAPYSTSPFLNSGFSRIPNRLPNGSSTAA